MYRQLAKTKLFWWCHCPSLHSVMEYECKKCMDESRNLSCRDATQREVLDELGDEIIEFAWDYLYDRKSQWSREEWLDYSRMLTKFVPFMLEIKFMAKNPADAYKWTGKRHNFTRGFFRWEYKLEERGVYDESCY